MDYLVVWTDDAEDDLIRIGVAAEDRTSIVAALRVMDRALVKDPNLRGESRQGNVRIDFHHPLGVEFEVIEETRTVYVLAVWSIAH